MVLGGRVDRKAAEGAMAFLRLSWDTVKDDINK